MASPQSPDTVNTVDKVELSLAHISDVAGQTFDYVIVGGGPSGLALASRLAEDPSITVALLEAGGITHQYDSISRPAQFGREHGNPDLVYAYETDMQPNLGRPLGWPRGRGLGGSSAINFMLFQSPPANDINNWEKLGSPGWNWDRYHAAVKRVESFHPPTGDAARQLGIKFELESRGTAGPIHTSYPKIQTAGEGKVYEAFKNIGIKTVDDSASGDINGIAYYTNSIDPRTNTRSYAETGYLRDNAHQSHFKVLIKASARKVLFREESDENSPDLVAAGVEFDHDGTVYTVQARKEVILSAGALRSSALLELSGVGNKKILEPLGITTLIHNHAVGENVQEHLVSPLTWLLNTEKESFQTLDLFADPKFAEEQVNLFAKGEGLFLTQINIIAWLSLSQVSTHLRTPELIAAAEARVAKDLESPEISRPGLREQYEIQLQSLKDESSPDCEIVMIPFAFPSITGEQHPGKPSVSLVSCLNRPFSRGSIHIKSADADENARMDPNVFDHDIDLELLVEMYKYCRKVAEVEPFKGILLKETAPGSSVVTDEDIKKFIKENVGSVCHTAGTCAMRPRDAGGVVDPSLKVYGTTNLRVCDLSIFPLHVAGHPQTVAYAVGEQLADIIKGETTT